MATVVRNFWIKSGTLSLPDRNIPFWGFADLNGGPQVPGPIIQARVGDIVRVRLYNNFFNSDPVGEPVSIVFPGQENVTVRQYPYGGKPQPVQPQYSGGNFISYTNYVEPDSYYFPLILQYEFEAQRCGIYLYESGTNPEKQIQMGVYGVIIIRPYGYNIPSHSNYKTAYGANTNSRYDVEKVLVLGELDSAMHQGVIPGGYYNILNFTPDYYVLNGRCYPDTVNDDDDSGQPYGSKISCSTGDRVLLRMINAGFRTYTISFGGLSGRVIAEGGYSLATDGTDNSYERTGVTLGAGQSADAVIIPERPGEFYIYDRGHTCLINDDGFLGSMMTKMDVHPTP
jgi:FtsP/CotA-like multicopper oxidase with cupredoxin domain